MHVHSVNHHVCDKLRVCLSLVPPSHDAEPDVNVAFSKRGHQIELFEPFSFTVGQGEAAVRDTKRNVNFAGADPRSDGEAIPQEPTMK